MMKKIYVAMCTVGASLLMNAQSTVNFGPSRSATQNSTRIETLLRNLRNNPNGPRIIVFDAEVYRFNRPIVVNSENVTFRGDPVANDQDPETTLMNVARDNSSNFFFTLGNNSTRVDRVTGEVTLGNNGNNPIGVRDIVFEDLILDNNFRTRAGAAGTIINNNDSQGTVLENVTLRRSDFMGIAAFNGSACHGLIVRDSKFEDIFDTCIFIMNRASERYGSLIRNLRAPFSITNTVFEDGYAEGVNADNGNDFFTDQESLNVRPQVLLRNRRVTAGGKRHAFPTNLRNSLISGNTFGRCQRWNIGMVQASNFRVINNRMNGPGAFPPLNGQARPENTNSSNFHFEQFTRGVRILRNTIVNNTDQRGSRITSSFISISSNEGRQRLSNDPVITVIPGIGGVPRRTDPIFNNTFLRGTPGCRLEIRRAPNNLTCRREFHEYGPRNIVIRQNSFSTNARVSQILDFRDAINFTVQDNNYAGNVPVGNSIGRSNRPAGSRNGIGNGVFGNNEITNEFIEIQRGERGNCNVLIDEPQFTGSFIDNNIDIENNAGLGSCSGNPIRIIRNGSGSASKQLSEVVNQVQEATITVWPNPTNNWITISGLNTVEESIVEVYHLNGSLLKSVKGVNSNTQIDMSNFSEGMYLINIISSEGDKIVKVVKN